MRLFGKTEQHVKIKKKHEKFEVRNRQTSKYQGSMIKVQYEYN